ncbi:putative alpha/beta hydrolase [Clostridioides difficile P64]|nr:alpha/beta hydrolase [Clostridioides difficile]ERM39736.1 putative alpha/beta hydrolase [Clostridioides difficile P64]
MDKVVIYIHGKGGNAEESSHYKPLFSDCDVVGLNYTAQYPWEAKEEFPSLFDLICKHYKSVQIVANSIGAYFAMNALSDKQIEKAYFISPIVNMEKLIADMCIGQMLQKMNFEIKKKLKQLLEKHSHGNISVM